LFLKLLKPIFERDNALHRGGELRAIPGSQTGGLSDISPV